MFKVHWTPSSDSWFLNLQRETKLAKASTIYKIQLNRISMPRTLLLSPMLTTWDIYYYVCCWLLQLNTLMIVKSLLKRQSTPKFQNKDLLHTKSSFYMRLVSKDSKWDIDFMEFFLCWLIRLDSFPHSATVVFHMEFVKC